MVHGEVDSMNVLADKIKSDLGGDAYVAKKGKSTNLLKLEKLKRS